jgi:CRISPR system Cascade subunit CasA
LANGLNYPPYPEWREPTATIKTRQTKNQLPTRVTLRCSVEKAAWRELHALAVIAVDKDSVGGPAALRDVSDGEAFDLWVGGLAASKAKLVDTIESVFHVPAAMLDEMSQRVYEQGVDWAELTGFRLSRAVSVYHREIGDDLNRPEFRDRRQQIQNKAAAQFWTDIEQIVPQLLQISEKPQKLGQPADWNNTDWGKAVWTAARAAYEQSCPHGTPRQMRAYALGLSSLYSAPAESAHSTIIEKEIEA